MQVKSMKNNYFEQCSKIPKSIKTYFLTLHFMFGQDFGFGNLFKKRPAKCLKYYSTFSTLTMFLLLVYLFMSFGDDGIWYWGTLAEIALNFCILKSSKYTVYNLLCDIHAAERIDVLEKETFGVMTSFYSLGMFLLKVFFNAVPSIFAYTSHYEMKHIYYAAYGICFTTVNVMYDVLIVIRFYIYEYVKNMEQSLKQDQDIHKLIERYDNIADYQDKIRRLCDYFMLMEFLVNIPKLMTSTWYMLSFIEKKFKWFTAMGEWMNTFHLIIQIVIPAAIAQMMKCRMDDIVQLLNKWEMVERDPEKNAEIARVMKYLERRKLQYEIWGLIPTDLTLPLSLISICTTYLIVIIQLTHLYD